MCFFQKSTPGVFSFIKNKNLRFLLEYDYSTCLESVREVTAPPDGEHYARIQSPEGPEWDHIREQACPIHTDTSYKMSMRVMCYIARHGWTGFVKSKTFIAYISNQSSWTQTPS